MFELGRVQRVQRLVDGVARVDVFVDFTWLDPELVAPAAEASAPLERISNAESSDGRRVVMNGVAETAKTARRSDTALFIA